MNRVLKWILAMVATVAILLLVLSIALPLLLNPNNYKDEINAAVLKETGRELTITGDISWRIFPSFGLEIDRLSLANRAGFGARPMLEVSEASVIVKLLPLFSRQLEIDRIDLEGVTAYLRGNTDGQNNWEDLVNRGAAGIVQETPADLEIKISNGELSLKSTARRVELAGFSTGTPIDEPKQAFELEGRFSLTLPQQDVAGDVNCEGLLQVARSQGLLGLQDVDFSISGTMGAAEDSVPLELETATDIIVDLGRDRAVLTDLTLQFFDLTAKGTINVTSLSTEPEYTGQLELAQFNPKQLIQSLGLDALQTQQADALTKMQAELDFSGSSSDMDIVDLKVVLDHSTLDGRLTIEAFDPLQLSFDLSIDTLNLDDYSMVPAAASDDDVEVGAAGVFVGSMLFFTGGGDLSITHLVTGGLTAGDVKVTVSSDADEIRLFPMSSRLYGGQHQGDIRVSFAAGQPILMLNQVVTGFETSTLLLDLAGLDRLHGTGDLYLKVRTGLGSSQQARQALTGDVGLSVIDGAIDGVDIPGTVAKVTRLLGKQNTEDTSIGTGDRMEFAELIVTGIINQGILKSDDLMLRSALVNATGKGTVNLVNETVNYVIYPVMVNELAAQVPEEYRGVSIPVRISGDLYEPDISLDIAAGLIASQNANIVNKAGEEASTLLKGLLRKKKDKE